MLETLFAERYHTACRAPKSRVPWPKIGRAAWQSSDAIFLFSGAASCFNIISIFMKITMKFIAFFAVVALTMSARSERFFEAGEGYSAPQISVKASKAGSDSCTVSLLPSDTKGKLTLVNFWSSEHPESRIAANEYAAIARGTGSQQLSLLSVNLDRSAALFREIVRRDRLDAETQYHVDATEAKRLVDAYNMRHGLCSFLIDEAGKIVAVNPARATIEAHLVR